MKKRLLLLAVPVLLVALAACARGASPTPPPAGLPLGVPIAVPATGASGAGPIIYPISSQQTGLWVSGEGKVSYVPDIALLTLGVEARAKTVAEAQGQAREAMNQVIAALKDKGVAERDIRTTSFSIQPQWEWVEWQKRQVLTGYIVSNQVAVKIRQVDRAGETIDAAAQAGGDLARIGGISFTIDNPAPLYAQAREKAVKDAVAKAQQIAGAAEVKLGRPIYISESTVSIPVPTPVRLEMKAAAPDIMPTPVLLGELEVWVSVQMVYSILE